MSYSVKEIFFTLQGEGLQAGRAAVFCRFSGCNLWSGKEEDRHSAQCTFCDTHFAGTDGALGALYKSAEELADALAGAWPKRAPGAEKYLVLTGGEPLLQVDHELIVQIKERGFVTAVETNGTLAVPAGIEWITVSPKAGTELKQTSGDELKLVYPQRIDPVQLLELDFDYFFIQPLYGTSRAETEKNMKLAVAYCLEHPAWRLSTQRHRLWGIP